MGKPGGGHEERISGCMLVFAVHETKARTANIPLLTSLLMFLIHEALELFAAFGGKCLYH